MDVDQEDVQLPYTDEDAQALQNRIGQGRLYLLEDASSAIHSSLHSPPRKSRMHGFDDDPVVLNDEDAEELNVPAIPQNGRDNGILFHGDPISNLPTQKVFAYITRTGAANGVLGLEWVDDRTVIIIWESTTLARLAFAQLRARPTSENLEDEQGFVRARPLPETLWPLEVRLEKTLQKDSESMEDTMYSDPEQQIRMRWARLDDVKEKGAKQKSRFYKMHGDDAGKEGYSQYQTNSHKDNHRDNRQRGGRREETAEDKKRRLDAELDSFIAGDEPPRRRSASPTRGPNRRRRRRSASPRRRTMPAVREWDVGKDELMEEDEFGRTSQSTNPSRRGGNRRGGGRGRDRPREGETIERGSRSKEDLDAELDAFFSSRAA